MPKPNPTIVAWTLNEIESSLRLLGLWSDAPRDDARIAASCTAFCADVLTFLQWLQYVLLPNARKILETDQAWPDGSMVATQAVRELNGDARYDDLLTHLAHFDALFTQPLDANGFPAWLTGKDNDR